jgi:hypothetical protein
LLYVHITQVQQNHTQRVAISDSLLVLLTSTVHSQSKYQLNTAELQKSQCQTTLRYVDVVSSGEYFI